MARKSPTGFTPNQIKAVVKRINAGETMAALHTELGVSQQTLARWRDVAAERAAAEPPKPKPSPNGHHVDPDKALGVGKPANGLQATATVAFHGLSEWLDQEVERRVREALARLGRTSS